MFHPIIWTRYLRNGKDQGSSLSEQQWQWYAMNIYELQGWGAFESALSFKLILPVSWSRFCILQIHDVGFAPALVACGFVTVTLSDYSHIALIERKRWVPRMLANDNFCLCRKLWSANCDPRAGTWPAVSLSSKKSFKKFWIVEITRGSCRLVGT